MSKHLETVQAIYAAFGRGDIPAILGHLADDVAWESWSDNHAQRAQVPWLLPRRGKEGALAFFQTAATLEIRDFQVLGFLAGTDQVAVEVVIDVVVPATGKRYRDEELHLWTFDATGKVTRMRHYTDTAKHIAAAR
jgi:uncharacterized protein